MTHFATRLSTVGAPACRMEAVMRSNGIKTPCTTARAEPPTRFGYSCGTTPPFNNVGIPGDVVRM